MAEKKRIFLLGGTGFIGAVLTRQLVADRKTNDVTMLIHRRARLRELEQIDTNTGSLTSFDLSLVDRHQPDTIVHLARLSGRGKIGRYMAALKGARANKRIINHLKRKESKPHIIYVSGTLVYGDCGETPVDEELPIHPIAFAREYIKAEKPWMDALERNDLPVTILRPPWIIGKGSWFAECYLRNIKQNRMVPLFGAGNNLMSLLDVEDCAGLIAHAVRRTDPGRCYNLFAPGACVSQLEFAERLAIYTGSEISKFSASETKKRYGQAFWEAFTFSNISATKNPEFLGSYGFKYPSVDEMIRNNLPAELCVTAR